MSGLLNGRRGAKEIQQPAPVFFSPEQIERMTVGYSSAGTDDFVEYRHNTRQLIDEMRRTTERLKIVLEAREDELTETHRRLQQCVKELCQMCGDDKHPENGTCKTCQWQSVKELDA
jgi:FixJ family two-component response regulator